DLAYKDLWVRLKGIYTDATNEIIASANYKLSSNYLQLPNWLQCPLQGDSELKGSIENPSLKGNLSCPLSISFAGIEEQYFKDFELVYELSPFHPKSVLAVKSLVAANETISAEMVEELRLEGLDLRGGVDLKIRSLKFEDIQLNDLKMAISLGGRLENPRINYTASLEKLINGDSLTISDLHSTGTVQNGVLAFSIDQEGSQGKILRGSGEIKLVGEKGPEIHNSKFYLIKYPLPFGNPQTFIEAELALSGPLNIEKLTVAGRGKVFIDSQQSDDPLELILNVNKAKADLSLTNSDKKLVAMLKISDLGSNARGDLDLKIAGQSFGNVISPKTCLDVGGELNYVFNISAPLYGDGRVNLYKLSAGCDQNALRVEMPLSLAIKKGDVSIANVKINSNQATLEVSGTVSLNEGFNLEANGSLSLDTLLPLVPFLDDLGGNVDLKLSVVGALQAPGLHGDAVLKSGRFSIASKGINASMIDGNLVLEGDRISIKKLSGELNSGDFAIDGYLIPMDLKRSVVNLHFDKIVLEPVEALLLIISGKLDAGIKDSGRPLLEGVLNIDSAQYQKNIDIKGLLGMLTSTIFGRKEAFQATARKFPDLDLKLQVNARRNIYVFTNWFGAELKTDLSVDGPISAPNLTGGFSTISGWLGFRNRRFIITSGSVNFIPPSTEPYLDLVAETKLYSSTGNPVSVVLEAKGLLRQPTIEFSSDQGLSPQDIFTLLATGQGASNTTVVDSVGRDLEKGSGLAISSVIPFLPLPGFFDDLTRIDNFYFEPELDPATGLVEPVAIATKNLGDQFTAVGKMGLGERRSVSRASIIYDLTPRLNIAGIFEAGNPEENASLGVDLSYTVFSRLGRAVKIKFEGNEQLSDADLMKRLSLNESVSIQRDDIPEIVSKIRDIYLKAGFRAAEARISCKGESGYCTAVNMHIKEGPI
ncbi:MAG: hypothetical protein GYA55_09345, partial [SAR324 cluster bacterium]|nr:hypothetical protein [SAR324 cluster bacterium]